MKLSRREKPAEAEADVVLDDESDETAAAAARKGRPTPKRRESQGKRGPVSAPKTRKEAMARQRQLAKEQKVTGGSAKPRSAAEQRAALRRGDDATALPRRDQGTTRKLARDYVDSKRMLSNYLLLLFPIMIAGLALPQLQILVLVVFVALLGEWYLVGRRIRGMAQQRYGDVQGSNLAIGFYAGSRAYLPRRWRLPAPQVGRGDPI